MHHSGSYPGMDHSGSYPGIDSHNGYCVPKSNSGSDKQSDSGSTKVTKMTVIKQSLTFTGVTRKALDEPQKIALLEKSIAQALGISGNDRITVVIISIVDKVLDTEGKKRRRMNSAGAEIIYEVRIEEMEDSETKVSGDSGSQETSIPLITASSIKSKMTALAAATSSDSSDTDSNTAGATALSEIKNAVAAQANVDVASIETQASTPQQSIRQIENPDEEDDIGSDKSNDSASGDSGSEDKTKDSDIGSIIGAVAGCLALVGVAGIAIFIYRNEARKKQKTVLESSSDPFGKPGHGYKNSFNPLQQQNEADIELVVAMTNSESANRLASATNKPKIAMQVGTLPPAPPPPGHGLKPDTQIALYDYEANGDGQISIKAGDTLIVDQHLDYNADWTSGTNVRTGEVGLYPTQYVKGMGLQY